MSTVTETVEGVTAMIDKLASVLQESGGSIVVHYAKSMYVEGITDLVVYGVLLVALFVGWWKLVKLLWADRKDDDAKQILGWGTAICAVIALYFIANIVGAAPNIFAPEAEAINHLINQIVKTG